MRGPLVSCVASEVFRRLCPAQFPYMERRQATVPALAKDALINESLFPGIKNSPQMHYIPHPPHLKGWGGGWGPWGGGWGI